MLLFVVVSNLLMIASFIWKYNSLPVQIPLFYSLPWGDDQLADLWMIFLLPLLMNGFIVLNLYLGKKYFSEHLIVQKIINYLNIFLTVAFTAIFLKIVFLVG